MEEQKKIKVLFLDDEALIRLSVTARLRRTNFEVIAVATPEEAMSKLQKEQFQIILTDVMIGSVDGFMFRDMVRGIYSDIPIIFFTAILNDSNNKFLSHVMEDAYSSYVPKNASNTVLIKQLEQVSRAYRAENEARLIKRERETTMHLASFVQTSMLPSWARLDNNFFYGICWRPFEQVSGDLYECIPIGNTSAIIIFGDISGHGVSASLAMTAVQAYLKQFATLTDVAARRVHEIASSIDKFIYQNLSGVAYMSGIVIYINSSERIIRFCNAGHPELLCFKPDGEQVNLNPELRGGFPLGMIPYAKYGEKDVVEAHVPDGAIFFAMSDGLLCLSSDDTGNDNVPNEIFNEIFKTSVRSVSETKMLSPAALPHRIFSMISDFGYVCEHDDFSLMAFGIERKMSERVASVIQINREKIDFSIKKIADRLFEFRDATPELIMKIELVLGEFLMNLHDHGFEDVTRHKEIALVCISHQDDAIAVRVFHRGKEWKPSDESVSPEILFDALNAKFSDHGRGVPLIRTICSSIQSETYSGLNINTFYIKV